MKIRGATLNVQTLSNEPTATRADVRKAGQSTLAERRPTRCLQPHPIPVLMEPTSWR